jgi:hypothetical protein
MVIEKDLFTFSAVIPIQIRSAQDKRKRENERA